MIKGKNGVYAFKLGILDDIRAGEQWYRMNKAKDWNDFSGRLNSFADRFDALGLNYATHSLEKK